MTLRQTYAGADAGATAGLTVAGDAFVTLQEWTFGLGPNFVVGVGNGVILGYLMYRSRLVPRKLAVLGLVGGPLLVLASVAAMVGSSSSTGPGRSCRPSRSSSGSWAWASTWSSRASSRHRSPPEWTTSDDHGRGGHQAVRPPHGGRRRHLHRRPRPRHRLPRPQRGGQVHHDARHRRPHPTDPRLGARPRSPVHRPAQPGPRGRGPARRLRPARRPHGARGPHAGAADHGPARRPGGRDARAGQPHRDRGGAPRARLLPRHAAAARHRAGAARRPLRADPRRAGQRARPGRHPVDARPAARPRRPGRHGAAVLAPAARDRGRRRRPRRDRQRADRGPGHQGRAARLDRDPRPDPHTSVSSGGHSPGPVSSSDEGDQALRVDADPERVGRLAHEAGIPLVELRAADGAGLEELFLELTADTQREELHHNPIRHHQQGAVA